MTCIYILKINNNNIGYYFDFDLARDFLYSCYYANFIKDTDNVLIETFKQNTNIKIHSENIYFNISMNTNNTNKTNTDTNNNKTNNNTNNDLESFSNSSKTTISDLFSDIESDSDSDSDNDSELNVDYISTVSDTNSKKSIESTFSEYMKKREDSKKKTKLMNDVGQEKIDLTYHINVLKLEKKKIQEKETEYKYDIELYKKFKQLKETESKFIIPHLFNTKYNIFSKLDETNELSFDNFMILYQPEVISTDYDSMFSAPSHYKTSKVSVQENYNQNQEHAIEELEELDQTYEQINEQIYKKYDNIIEINKKCEDFVEESYDNLFKTSHNLLTDSIIESDSISEIKSESDSITELESESDSGSESD